MLNCHDTEVFQKAHQHLDVVSTQIVGRTRSHMLHQYLIENKHYDNIELRGWTLSYPLERKNGSYKAFG